MKILPLLFALIFWPAWAFAQVDDSYIMSVTIPFHADATANVTLTNQAAAETLFGGSARHIQKYNMSNFTRCRLASYVVTASASAASPRIVARYSTTSQTTVGGFTAELGTSAISQTLFTGNTGPRVTSWIPLAAGAMTDVWVALVAIGGDAVADPALGSVSLQCR